MSAPSSSEAEWKEGLSSSEQRIKYACPASGGECQEPQGCEILGGCMLRKEKPQPSPTWDEVVAIRKGKSDIDRAERIWQLERELRLLKRAHGDALKEWAYAEGLLIELQSATRQRFDLTPQQVAQLRDFSFGGENGDPEEAMPVTIGYLPEHEDGPGWYVWAQEYPEEGSLPLVTYATADKTTSDKGQG